MIMTPRVPPPLAATSGSVGSGPSDRSKVFARRQARLAGSFCIHPPSPLGSFPGHWQPVPSRPGGTPPQPHLQAGRTAACVQNRLGCQCVRQGHVIMRDTDWLRT
jgi:hypothetical protein